MKDNADLNSPVLVPDSTLTKLEAIPEKSMVSRQKPVIKPQIVVKNPLHKPSKYHYHLKTNHIYGDKALKICGQCTLPSNLAKDLRFLDKNMRRSSSVSEDFIESSSSASNNHHNSTSQLPKLSKIRTKDFINLHRASIQALNTSSKFDIDFDVIDLTTERESGPNLPIVTLPLDLFKFKQLKRLHLDCNQIRVIPDELGDNLINLEILTLSNNCIKTLPDSMSNLGKLSSLHLSSNQFEKLPPVVYRIQSLRFLDLCSNEFTTVDKDIEKLLKLESLLLFHNKIREVPVQIGRLVNLRTLWLGDNRLTRLPREIVNLKLLDWNDYLSSNIDRNPLKEPPVGVCSKGLLAITQYFEADSESEISKN